MARSRVRKEPEQEPERPEERQQQQPEQAQPVPQGAARAAADRATSAAAAGMSYCPSHTVMRERPSQSSYSRIYVDASYCRSAVPVECTRTSATVRRQSNRL